MIGANNILGVATMRDALRGCCAIGADPLSVGYRPVKVRGIFSDTSTVPRHPDTLTVLGRQERFYTAYIPDRECGIYTLTSLYTVFGI